MWDKWELVAMMSVFIVNSACTLYSMSRLSDTWVRSPFRTFLTTNSSSHIHFSFQKGVYINLFLELDLLWFLGPGFMHLFDWMNSDAGFQNEGFDNLMLQFVESHYLGACIHGCPFKKCISQKQADNISALFHRGKSPQL